MVMEPNEYGFEGPDNPEYPGSHGDGCRCLNCTHPYQMYCESCGGPMQHEGGGFFKSHAYVDCLEWLKCKDQFDELPVMAGCRPEETAGDKG